MIGLKTHGKVEEDSVTSAASQTGALSQIDTRQLAPGTQVIVDTARSKYRLIITDGPAGLARMQGGRMFPDPTAVLIEGTRNKEHELTFGLISVGRGFDFIVWNSRGRTSPVQSISVSAPVVLQGTSGIARVKPDEQT